MLTLVREAADGMTAAEVVDATGLHPSTVRAHLDQLTESGLLTRERHGDGTPGRPAWRYRPAPGADTATGTGMDNAYRALAAALVAHLARDADDPPAATGAARWPSRWAAPRRSTDCCGYSTASASARGSPGGRRPAPPSCT
jgi:predicted ArsR family transcriptional regulator